MLKYNVSCGLQPVGHSEVYNIRTADIEAWLKNKFDAAIKVNNDQVENTGRGFKINGTVNPTVKAVQKNKILRAFAPLYLQIPSSECVDKGAQRKKQSGDEEIFVMSDEYLRREMGGDVVRIYPCIKRVIDSLRYYHDNEPKQGSAPDFSIEQYIANSYNMFGISKNSMNALMQNARIKEYKQNTGNVVAVLINPILVFHAMLADKDKRDERYSISVTGLTPISNTQMLYRVERIVNPPEKKKSDNLLELVTRGITAGPGGFKKD